MGGRALEGGSEEKGENKTHGHKQHCGGCQGTGVGQGGK